MGVSVRFRVGAQTIKIESMKTKNLIINVAANIALFVVLVLAVNEIAKDMPNGTLSETTVEFYSFSTLLYILVFIGFRKLLKFNQKK